MGLRRLPSSDGLNLIVLHPARLIYVLGPKLGSTGMVLTFLNMVDVPLERERVRGTASTAMTDGRLKDAGLHFERCSLDRVRTTCVEYPGYTVLANVRDPYARALSAYFSKLNRYAKFFAPPVFRRGKVRQALAGPGHWADNRIGNLAMQRSISFEDMLLGLQRHGTGFDPHFDLQVRILGLGEIGYTRLMPIETLDHDLLPALKEFGVPGEMLERVSTPSRRNTSRYDQGKSNLVTPDTDRLVEKIYAMDFERLGYPRRL